MTAVLPALLLDERCARDIDVAREVPAASVAPVEIEENLQKLAITIGWLH